MMKSPGRNLRLRLKWEALGSQLFERKAWELARDLGVRTGTVQARRRMELKKKNLVP